MKYESKHTSQKLVLRLYRIHIKSLLLFNFIFKTRAPHQILILDHSVF